MLTQTRKLMQRNEGASIVEFAIILPVFLLLILGIIEFSLVMFISSVIEGATNNVARLNKTGFERSTNPDETARKNEDLARIRDLILSRGYNIIRPENLDVIIVPSGGSDANTLGGSGEMVTYQTTYRWNIITPFFAEMIGDGTGDMTMTTQVVVINEPYEEDPVNN